MTPKLLTPVPKIALIALVLIIAASPFIASRAVGQSAAAPIDERSFDESTSVSTPTAPFTQTMGITQTLSDEAQRNTIAFDGLAFLTGSLGADSFFPPGKVADFWGFQYLRDNDLSQMGHNPLFLTSAAFNMWNVLTTDQRAQLKVLANAQVTSIGDLAWVLAVLDKWLEAAGIREGHVFRSFWRGGQSIRGPLSVRAVENIVSKYPVINEQGKPLTVHPHDLRRTYARRLYEGGMDLVAISQNLGHASTRTTLLYIGELGADKRRAPGGVFV